MDIRSCYEAGAVLFWLLFAYLFMDKFLFRGQLGEICFGKARCRMAKALRSAAGWFDPVKEERKKGRGRAYGKSGSYHGRRFYRRKSGRLDRRAYRR